MQIPPNMLFRCPLAWLLFTSIMLREKADLLVKQNFSRGPATDVVRPVLPIMAIMSEDSFRTILPFVHQV